MDLSGDRWIVPNEKDTDRKTCKWSTCWVFVEYLKGRIYLERVLFGRRLILPEPNLT